MQLIQYGQNNHLNGIHLIEVEQIRFNRAIKKTNLATIKMVFKLWKP